MAERGKAVRERIVDAAVQLLGDSGAKRLAQPRIAREAGVPQGHLTYYFPHRSDLLAAVTERYTQALAADVKLLVDETNAAIAKSGDRRAPFLAWSTEFAKDRRRVRSLVGLLLEAEDDPGVRGSLLGFAASLQHAIGLAIDRDESDLDAEMILSALLGFGVTHMLASDRDESRLTELVARLGDWLTNAPSAAAAHTGVRRKRSAPVAKTGLAPFLLETSGSVFRPRGYFR